MRRLAAIVCLAAGLAAQAAGAAPNAGAASPLTARGLDHFYNLEYGAAIADFQAATAAQPASAAAWNHLSQALLYREMYRIGALQSQLYGKGDAFLQQELLPVSPAADAAFLASNNRAMALAQADIAAHPNDAHAHYNLASAWGLRGNYDFSLRNAYFAALRDAKSARREAALARSLDPNFPDPLLILGVHNYVAGSLPWTARIFSTLLGYSGDKELGRRQIAEVAASSAGDRTDAAVLLFVVDRRDGLNAQAAPILARLSLEYPRNFLFAVEAGEALEAAGQHAAARAQFQSVVDRARSADPGFTRAPLDQVWYDLGRMDALFQRWPAAAQDFVQSEQAPGARTSLAQAAALAAGRAFLRAGNAVRARREFQRCQELDPSSDLARKAASALRQ